MLQSWILALLVLAAIAGLAYALGTAAKVLLLAFALAYLLQPLIARLERWHIKRKLSIPLICILLVLMSAGIIAALIPLMIQQVRDLSSRAPDLIRALLGHIEELLLKFGFAIDLQSNETIRFVKDQITTHLQEIATPAIQSLGATVSGGFSLILWFFNLILFPVFLVYLLYDFENIKAFLKSLVPPNRRDRVNAYILKLDDILSAFIRGQMIVCLVLACIYGLGLWIIGLPFGLLIGISCGLLSIIPYVGFGSGIIAALVLLIVYGSGPSLWIASGVVFLIGQVIETYILTPKLVGNRVGLGSLATILAVIIGGELGGLAGMFIAIPLAGFLVFVGRDAVKAYQNSFSRS